MPSLIDATHFRDAACTDVFVTRDAGLRLVAASARTPLIVIDFERLAREVMAGQQGVTPLGWRVMAYRGARWHIGESDAHA